MFSRRTQHDSELNTLTAALRRRRAAGFSVCDLTESNPTLTALPYDRERLLSALGDPRALSYEPASFGLPSARATISELQRVRGFAVPIEHILLTSSTSEAYAYLFKVLCDPGDQILIPRPSYPLFEHLAVLEDVSIVNYALAYDGAWHIDFDSLERARTPRCRAIVVVNPNNPTGSFLKQDELSRLASFGLPIISDEVFSSFSLFDDARRVQSVLQSKQSLVFSLGGLSKLAALPQMKLAWTCVAGPEPALRELLPRLEFVADTFLSPSTPVQWALPELLAASGPVQRALQQRIVRNFQALAAALKDSAATPLYLEGGWYATVRLPALKSEAEWVQELLEIEGVLTQPGFFYDFYAGEQLVLSLITDETTFAFGLRRIAEHIRSASA